MTYDTAALRLAAELLANPDEFRRIRAEALKARRERERGRRQELAHKALQAPDLRLESLVPVLAAEDAPAYVLGYRQMYPGANPGSALTGRYQKRWHGPRLTAECFCDDSHLCGIWAYSAPQEHWQITAEVLLWGIVIEHESGYRAEHAQIVRLAIAENTPVDSDALERRYRVPIIDKASLLAGAEWEEV